MSLPNPVERTVVFCPGCGRRYALAPDTLAKAGATLVCGTCETVFNPQPNSPRAAAPAVAKPSDVVRRTVVVAHESPAVCATVGRVLEEAGYIPRYVHDGARAVAAFDPALPDRPAALVLDVGVPEVLAFQAASIIKARPGGDKIPIILLASVFERTRYKRKPTSLHGADTYLELHHVPDRLGALLQDLLDHNRPPPSYRGHLPVERARADALRGMEHTAVETEEARNIARRLVSDVALYQEASILRGMDRGDPLAEPDVRTAMAEARSMFLQQVGVGVPDREALFEEALAWLVAGLGNGPDPGASR